MRSVPAVVYSQHTNNAMKHLLTFLLLLAAYLPASAQLDVRLVIPRRIFLRGESVEASVSIRNLTGHEVTLRDTEGHQWFSFEIFRGSDTPVAPHDIAYKNEPLTLLNGDSVTRKVNLLALYPVNELATYKVRAAVYFYETKKYIESDELKMDISDGRKVWSRTVGVPDSKPGAGEYHELTLLSFQTQKELTLYARIEDQTTGTILGTYPLGRIMQGARPTAEFDDSNTLYALHNSGPSQYALSKISVNGEWLGQTMWSAYAAPPASAKSPTAPWSSPEPRTKEPPSSEAPPSPKSATAPSPSPRSKGGSLAGRLCHFPYAL